MKKYLVLLFLTCSLVEYGVGQSAVKILNKHQVQLDSSGKIIPWTLPLSKAYDLFLHQRWNFIKTSVPFSPGPPPRSSYPQYYFYCGFWVKNGRLEPDMWMNDVGEKIPNWFESARLYYAYTGDSSILKIVEDLAGYAIDHGTSPATFDWPYFPYTTTNAGDTLFRGFTRAKRFVLHEIQVDHAGDLGITYFRLYQYTGKEKFKTAALNIANTLVNKVRTGSLTQSPWPYLIVMTDGQVVSEYGANWIGCYELLDNLAREGIGDIKTYREACKKVKDFLLEYPLKTGYWTDGHTDNDIRSHTYKSNLSASNFKLYLFDHPEFDPLWKSDIPKLIKWSEDYFVYRCEPGEPATQWGANLLGEQDTVLIKMDYQTARYAAECARWYAYSGDQSYKEKAYRALNWVTYCNDEKGMALENPVTREGIASNWWSDEYGECTRMFYHAFAGVPEWAPPGENHILFSASVLTKVKYGTNRIEYNASTEEGTDYLRLNFLPKEITLNGKKLILRTDTSRKGYTVRKLEGGDYSINIRRNEIGSVIIN